DIYGDTSIHYAVAHNDKSLTEFLINECKVDVNGGDCKRPSALDIASFNQNLELQKLLVNNNGLSRYQINHESRKRKISQDELIRNIENLSITPHKGNQQSVITNAELKAERSSAAVEQVTLNDDEFEKQISEFNSAARDQMKLKNYQEALKYRQHENDLLINHFGYLHPAVARSYYNIAVVYHNKCDYDSAASNYTKAIDIRDQLPLSYKDPDFPNYNTNRALVYATQHQYDKALENFTQALSMRKTYFPIQYDEIQRLEQFIERIEGQRKEL
ncbi:unnamed protein product, partial [Didymodactylos carnosus]